MSLDSCSSLIVQFSPTDLQIRCMAHVLNLAAKSCLGLIEGVISTVRENIKVIRKSPLRKSELKEYYQQRTAGGVHNLRMPKLDVATRWNSTYEMLKSAMELKSVSIITVLL
jgi:hypothetical protein